MFVVIYFFMIRPQQKRAKQEKEFESALKVGEKIITKSGIHGKIAEIAETTVGIACRNGHGSGMWVASRPQGQYE